MLPIYIHNHFRNYFPLLPSIVIYYRHFSPSLYSTTKRVSENHHKRLRRKYLLKLHHKRIKIFMQPSLDSFTFRLLTSQSHSPHHHHHHHSKQLELSFLPASSMCYNQAWNSYANTFRSDVCRYVYTLKDNATSFIKRNANKRCGRRFFFEFVCEIWQCFEEYMTINEWIIILRWEKV